MSMMFSTRGRLGRSKYQNYYLVSLSLCTISLLVYEISIFFGMQELAFTFALACIAITFLSMSTAAVRRLHDLDRPAWHLMLTLVPVYGLYLFLSLLCIKGEEEINLYGIRPEPL